MTNLNFLQIIFIYQIFCLDFAELSVFQKKTVYNKYQTVKRQGKHLIRYFKSWSSNDFHDQIVDLFAFFKRVTVLATSELAFD